MDPSSFDRIARLLGGATSRRASIAAAAGTIAGGAAAAKPKDPAPRKDAVRNRDRRQERESDAGKAASGNRNSGPAGPAGNASRPGPQGPCGDGSKSDNTCSLNIDCCTNYCVGKRCRCKSRGMACSSRKECCRGLVCSAGACSGPASGPAPAGPAGPTGPTGPGFGPLEGPTGAILYDNGGGAGETATLFYDYAGTGFVGIGTPGPTGALHVANPQAGSPAFVVQAASGQTGPLSIWQDNTGAEMFRLTADSLNNLFLGNQAGGASITNGDDNVGIGKSVLKSVTSGYRNIAVGNYALENLNDSNSNVAIGYYAGNAITSGDYNTLVGKDAGYGMTDGDQNVAIGYEALYNGSSASGVVAVGTQAGYEGESVLNSVFIGQGAGASNEDGESNTYVGYQSGNADSYGSFNTFIGANAGGSTQDGDYNIAIGASAYVADTTGSNQLSIGNLIYGIGLDGTEDTISTGKIGIGVKAPTQKLEVNGNVKATNVTVPSDLRLKQDIAPVSGALETVAALRPVTYGWKDTTRFGEKREFGLIAQEVAPVVPSVVHGSEADEFALDYAKLVPVLIGAIQELQAEIATLKRGDA